MDDAQIACNACCQMPQGVSVREVDGRGRRPAMRWMLIVGASLWSFGHGAAFGQEQADRAPSAERAEAEARALEQRLHAPCCREQMLEAHDSEPARRLRLELRERFKAGASRDEVEQALIAQFGPTIISIPRDRDPRSGLSAWLMAALGIAALAIFAFGLRWTRQARAAQQPALAGDIPSDELDAKLDRDLRRLDE